MWYLNFSPVDPSDVKVASQLLAEQIFYFDDSNYVFRKGRWMGYFYQAVGEPHFKGTAGIFREQFLVDVQVVALCIDGITKFKYQDPSGIYSYEFNEMVLSDGTLTINFVQGLDLYFYLRSEASAKLWRHSQAKGEFTRILGGQKPLHIFERPIVLYDEQ